MKARLLRKLLNDTNYIIGNHTKYISVGSPMCHDLIKVDKETLNITYALDTFRKGRASIDHQPLLVVWDTLEQLVKSGEITDIINGNDHIENGIPVFYVKRGDLIEEVTDEFGWPNTTNSGEVMHDNTHFRTREQAIQYGIELYKSHVQSISEIIKYKERQLQESMDKLNQYESYVSKLENLKSQ